MTRPNIFGIWLMAMMMAAALVKPMMTGWAIKRIREPSLKNPMPIWIRPTIMARMPGRAIKLAGSTDSRLPRVVAVRRETMATAPALTKHELERKLKIMVGTILE